MRPIYENALLKCEIILLGVSGSKSEHLKCEIGALFRFVSGSNFLWIRDCANLDPYEGCSCLQFLFQDRLHVIPMKAALAYSFCSRADCTAVPFPQRQKCADGLAG